MQQLSGSGGLSSPLSALLNPLIRALGPASGAENNTWFFGPALETSIGLDLDWLIGDAAEGELGGEGRVEAEEGLLEVGAREGLMVWEVGGRGLLRRRA